MNKSLSARIKRRNLVNEPGEIEIMENPVTRIPAYSTAATRMASKRRQAKINRLIDNARGLLVGRHKHLGSISVKKIKTLIKQAQKAASAA